MEIKVTDYELEYDIRKNCFNEVLILPYSIDADFKGSKQIVYTQSSISVLKKLSQSGIDTSFAVGNKESVAYIENRSIDWFGPTLFFSLALLNQNPGIVSVCLNVLSAYIYDICKGKSDNPNIRCSFVFEDEKKKKKVYYEGPVSGLKDVEKIANGK